ncbi:serine/threonine-protein kinase [Streptomyces sp. NK15101]|uniref:serine/threonine-protein kinase n=1 Tax=Streptomyces sp. NK15101 TaxID=2873261 RepID=UPI001CECE360|nr:serine/threonine-protein kinase [Streptomyces sp. NK15101]
MQVRARPFRPDLMLTAHAVAGRYRLDRLLGRGGSADVYEALDLRLRRPVAVKVFRPEDARRTEARCGEEARLLARMQHPGLVTIYDTGDDEGRPYLVMQLVRGTTLQRRMARTVLTQAETCRMGTVLASALAHVHARGVVHRDVKPSNILLDRTDAPHLSDFGISRLIDESEDCAPEGDGTLIGTASYMAPEQALCRNTGPEADVYSLGLVLLEALKGEAEYGGAPLEAALAHLDRPPVLPPDLPAELAALLTAMTARAPGARPDAAVCARVLAGLARAGRTSPAAPGCASRGGRTARPVSGGATGPVGARTSARSPGVGRSGRPVGARAVAATLVTLGLTVTGSLGSAPAGEAAVRPAPQGTAAPRPGSAEGARTIAPAPLVPRADDPHPIP